MRRQLVQLHIDGVVDRSYISAGTYLLGAGHGWLDGARGASGVVREGSPQALVWLSRWDMLRQHDPKARGFYRPGDASG